MSHILTVNPSGYNSTNSSYSGTSSTYPISNGYANSNSTSYARITCRTGSSVSTYISYTFDLSSIPNDAIIESVECIAKARISSTGNLQSAYIQLYNNTTAKGSAVSCFDTSTSTKYTLNCGNWSKDELNNLQIRYTATRKTSGNTSKTAYLYIYGADLTITYLVASELYTITISSNSGGNVDPSGTIQIERENSFELEITPEDKYKVKSVTNNGEEVEVIEKSSSPKIYSYYIPSVTNDITIIVTFEQKKDILYIKNSNGEWKQVSQVFRKINNEWIEQTDLSSVFDINTNYMKGEV